MGISRDSRHKRRNTGGRKANLKKKRLYESGRPGANTKLGARRIHEVRTRGGNTKQRAMRLDTGNFSWGSEVIARKSRVIDVVYNASNNELVRTKTLVKGAIILIDATPFRNWYEQHYGIKMHARKGSKLAEQQAVSGVVADTKKSNSLQRKLDARCKNRTIDSNIEDQLVNGKIYASISSRPGQSGRCDGYILEGKELDFYVKHLKKKK